MNSLKLVPDVTGKKMYPDLVANPDYTRIIDAGHYRTLGRHLRMHAKKKGRERSSR